MAETGWTWEGGELSEGYVAAVYDESGERIADYLTEDRARLIASAPDLLEALQAIVSAADDAKTYARGGVMAQIVMDPAELRARGNAALEAGRAAIANATGAPA